MRAHCASAHYAGAAPARDLSCDEAPNGGDQMRRGLTGCGYPGSAHKSAAQTDPKRSSTHRDLTSLFLG